MNVFVDTGTWLALENRKDYYHNAAKKHLEKLKKKRARVYTNSYVLAETFTRLIYDVHLQAAKNFSRVLTKGIQKNFAILEVDAETRERAWKELERYSDHKLSFTDGTIIANFKDYNLDEIFTFDKHFQDCNLPTNPF